MKREEFRTVYDSGFEATFSLVQSLSHNIDALTARVQQLEDRLAKNSRNSSKPPSSDDPAKPKPKSLRRSSGKKPGGQKGHPGSTLSLVRPTPRRGSLSRRVRGVRRVAFGGRVRFELRAKAG